MFVKDALSALPAKAAVLIAPLLVIGVLSYYYWEQYNRCSGIKMLRSSMSEYLRNQSSSGVFRLADFTGFAWDKARIIGRLEPNERNAECPFGWNWPSGQRQELLESGLMSAILFAHQDSIISYFEFRSDEIAFHGTGSSLTPERAVFDIRSKSDSNGFNLTLRIR